MKDLLSEHADRLLFHDWQHVQFVTRKAVGFAADRGADPVIVRAAALTHDLNYLVAPGSLPAAAAPLRASLLNQAGYTPAETARVEQVVIDAHTGTRGPSVDPETGCLSDADTLYKALPVTPVLYAHRFMAENDVTLAELASKGVSDGD